MTQQYTVQRDDGPDLRFTGDRIAWAYSSADRAHPDWSGETGRSTDLALYRTKAGRFVCTRVSETQWQGERDRHEAVVVDSEAEVIEFLGHGWLAEAIYREAGIECVEDVD